MEEKIREYVRYMLKNDNDPNKEEKIEEISANLIERYYDLLSKGKSEEAAYKETMKYFSGNNEEAKEKRKFDTDYD